MFQQKKQITISNGQYIVNNKSVKELTPPVKSKQPKKDDMSEEAFMSMVQPMCNLEKSFKDIVGVTIDKIIDCLENLKTQYCQ